MALPRAQCTNEIKTQKTAPNVERSLSRSLPHHPARYTKSRRDRRIIVLTTHI